MSSTDFKGFMLDVWQDGDERCTRMSSTNFKGFMLDVWQDGDTDERCERRPVLLGAHFWWDTSIWVLLMGTTICLIVWLEQCACGAARMTRGT